MLIADRVGGAKGDEKKRKKKEKELMDMNYSMMTAGGREMSVRTWRKV